MQRVSGWTGGRHGTIADPNSFGRPLIRMVRVPLSSRTSRSRSTVVSSLQRRLQFGFVHLLVRLDAIGQLAR
jgi:hypothetical protein